MGTGVSEAGGAEVSVGVSVGGCVGVSDGRVGHGVKVGMLVGVTGAGEVGEGVRVAQGGT